MDKKVILTAIVVALVVVILILMYMSSQIHRNFENEAEKRIEQSKMRNTFIITMDDISKLPEPVQKYLIYVGVVGKERVLNVRTLCSTDFKTSPEGDWAKMETVEYDFYGSEPSRLAYMKFKVNNIPVFGLDTYMNSRGSMLMKPMGLITAVEEKGNPMDDTSAAVMMFLSMCTGAPAALIDERISWSTVDSSTVIAEFNDNDCKISAILKFNDKGELIEFSTEDKYYNPTGKEYKKVRWSTPVTSYKDINGLRLPTYGEAIWHFPEGDYCYGKNTLLEIEYNVMDFN